jgi:hypothetical protein
MNKLARDLDSHTHSLALERQRKLSISTRRNFITQFDAPFFVCLKYIVVSKTNNLDWKKNYIAYFSILMHNMCIKFFAAKH